MLQTLLCYFFFFFNDTATTEIYTLSLHDALPISLVTGGAKGIGAATARRLAEEGAHVVVADFDEADRKSTRLNSSHLVISYAVFCLKKKKRCLIHASGALLLVVCMMHALRSNE